MAHLEPAASTLAMPDMQRRTQRRAVVARGGLDVYVGERRLGADLAVGDAVHRASASEAQPRTADALMQCAQNPECSLFVDALQRGGNRLMPLRERLPRPARGTEQRL